MKCRHTMSLFFITLPICVLLRTIQLIFTIDKTTGFINQQYSKISTVIMFIICAAIAAVGLISLFVTSDELPKVKSQLNPVLAVVSLLAGGMFIYDTVSALAVLSSGNWYGMFLIILGLLSAAVFIAYGLKNIYPYNLPSLIFVIPVFYYVVNLINVFVSTSSLALVTENILLIFTNGALLLFMFEFAKFENDLYSNEAQSKKLLAIGIVAGLLCAVSAIPKAIVFISTKIVPSKQDISSMLLMLCVGAFVLTFIICNFADKKISRKTHIAKHLAE